MKFNKNGIIKEINTIDYLPKNIKDRNGNIKKLNIRNNENLLNILPHKERVHLFLSLKNKKIKIKEIYNNLNLDRRGVSRCLLILEKENKIKRIKGKSLNPYFRLSDKWIINQKFDLNKYNNLYVWYVSKHKNNYKTNYFLFPKKIKLNKDFFTTLGLLDAEKTKFDVKIPTIEFVNSELLILKKVISFFENFNIKPEDWAWRLIFNGRVKDLVKNKVNKIELFWIKNLELNNSKKLKSSPYFTNVMGEPKLKTIYGSVNLNYNNIILNNFLNNLSLKIKLLILKNKEFMYAYLSGFFSGEAYIGDRQIQIASNDKREYGFTEKILQKLDIKYGNGSATINSPPRFLIAHIEDFLKFYDNNLFDIHPKKKKALILRLLKYQNKYKRIIDNNLRNKLKNELNEINNFLNKRVI